MVIRVVEHRSLRRSRQDLRVAMACSTRARIFAWERLTACCALGEGLPPAPVRDADRAAGALVGLVRPAGDAGLGEGVDDAVLAGRADVVDGPGQGW